jgi:hypothetical protein
VDRSTEYLSDTVQPAILERLPPGRELQKQGCSKSNSRPATSNSTMVAAPDFGCPRSARLTA